MNRVKSIIPDTRWWDLPAALLLLVIITTAFTRLVATEWTDHLRLTRTIAWVGLVAGLALGVSRFSPRRATFFAFIYGLFFITYRTGLILGVGILWQERVQSLFGRVGVIITHLIQQKAVPDNLLFLVLISIVFWVLSVHAGYSLTRYANPWNTVLPTGVALVLIHSYDAYLSSRAWYLVVYLFFALLFVARVTYLNNRKRWLKNNTYTPPYLGLDFIRIALVAAVVLLLLSWTIPALANTLPAAEDAWLRVKQPWNDIRNTFDNAFASLRSTVGFVTDYYGPNLLLGRGNRLGDTIIFAVATPPEPPDGFRFYWKARVYDYYEFGWSSTLQTSNIVEPDDFDLTLPDVTGDDPQNYSFTFTLGSPIATLFTPHQAVWLSRPARAEFATNSDGTSDIGSYRATPPLRAGETYHVRSSLSGITVAELRDAGTDYPEWVTDRYLQLPASITPRTLRLAEEIADGQETPYDIVTAITGYLRTNIEYSETIPPLPANQELVDWFLFDLQKGFCNYYATSEIVMLRSLGIPARLAAGYAQGELQEGSTDTFVVRQSSSHAWPEVYFPGIGWVEFEPTVSQPTLIRPLGERPELNNVNQPRNFPEGALGDGLEPPVEEGLEEEAGAVDLGNKTLSSTNLIVAIGLLLALIVIMIPLIRRKQLHKKVSSFPIFLENGIRRLGIQPPAFLRSWAHRATLSPLARAYLEINLALNRLGNHPEPTDTPTERAIALVATLPPAQSPTHILLSEYQLATHSPKKTADIQTARKAGHEIRWLSYKALYHRLMDLLAPKPDSS
jgi:transglutaminase-like putative cysteine protease